MFFFFNDTNQYERIPYSSFLWKLGTTSFRTREFNRMTEWQLRLLDEFWKKPENQNLGWETAVKGQNGIYEIKNRYYDWLVENKFTKGNDRVKYKAAREKTSGLYDMGFINNEHRLTEVGYTLLEVTENESFLEKTQLGISKDSEIYLKQLLKLSDSNTGKTVRPFIIVLYLLSKLEFLSYDEFRYLAPLCTDPCSTSYILQSVQSLRKKESTIDEILTKFLLSKKNYQEGLNRFIKNKFSENLLLSVSMNRKSANYDKPYISLYLELYAVYIEHDTSRIIPLLESLKKLQPSIASKWKQLIFDTVNTAKIKNNPEKHINRLSQYTTNEKDFKHFFYLTMHLNKAKATLEDYLDLNRRYLSLTNCFIFDENQIKLDIVPKQFFNNAINELYKQAYQKSDLLFQNCTIDSICTALKFNEETIIKGINQDLNTHITTIEAAYNEIERIKYTRFNKLIDEKFNDETLLQLLDYFERRNDSAINQAVTDNADIPTIFEYIIGIIWYKASEKRGRILNFMKLSLDANLLPVTHAAGGEADIVYEYTPTKNYPAHCVLLEATLTDSTNQRRQEMEPVSRHVGNHILKTNNNSSYGIFITTFLHANVISDFKARKHIAYADSQTFEHYIQGMKITPLDTKDLKNIIRNHITYKSLYQKFEKAYQQSDFYQNPKQWYDNLVKIY